MLIHQPKWYDDNTGELDAMLPHHDDPEKNNTNSQNR